MAKLLSVVGARPQFVKLAVVCRALEDWPEAEHVIVHTGQHYDAGLSDVFFKGLAIPDPAHHLGVGGGSHGAMTGRMLIAIEPVIEREAPDAVLVFGDTNSTLAGALAAVKLHVPVIHVEAGLRSFDRRMPEEVNRVLTDHVSGLLLCPTATAMANLAAEGVRSGVHHVGDVMYDATRFAVDQTARDYGIFDRLDITPGSYTVLTLHRAENTETAEQLAGLLNYVRVHAQIRPIVLPLHPRTEAALDRYGLTLEGFLACPPVDYFEMVQLLGGARTVFTDSGGLQKEAYFHRVPCVTLRNTTEWVETITAGWNRLWRDDYVTPRTDIDDYGTGHAGDRIVEILRHQYG